MSKNKKKRDEDLMSKDIFVVFTHGTGLFSASIEAVEKLGELIQGDNGVDFLPTHCGMVDGKRFQEAIASGFVGNNINRYKPENIRVYKLTVTNEADIARGDKRFNEILGLPYAPEALICGAAYALFDIKLPAVVGENDCSGDVTDVLRAYGYTIDDPDVPCSSIVPNKLIGIIDKIGTPIDPAYLITELSEMEA